MLDPARQALRHIRLTEETAEAIRGGDQGLVRVGFAGASTQRSLPTLSRAVRNAHPGIELQLQSQTYVYTALEMLAAGTLDLAFARLPTDNPLLDSRVVEVEELVCALPHGHPAAELDGVPIESLREEDFVSLPSNHGSILQSTMMALCITAGYRPNVVQFAPDTATVLALVAAGVGVTITLSTAVGAQVNDIVYRPLTGIHPSHMFATLAWRRDDPSPALQRVLRVSEIALPTPNLSDFQMNPFLNSIGVK